MNTPAPEYAWWKTVVCRPEVEASIIEMMNADPEMHGIRVMGREFCEEGKAHVWDGKMDDFEPIVGPEWEWANEHQGWDRGYWSDRFSAWSSLGSWPGSSTPPSRFTDISSA